VRNSVKGRPRHFADSGKEKFSNRMIAYFRNGNSSPDNRPNVVSSGCLGFQITKLPNYKIRLLPCRHPRICVTGRRPLQFGLLDFTARCPTQPTRRLWASSCFVVARSVAANYRAACRGRSRAEWIAKIGLVVEEADETVFWLEMLSDCEIVPVKRCEDILKEARELSAIFTASQHTARRAG
jgi:four helix bundle protein